MVEILDQPDVSARMRVSPLWVAATRTFRKVVAVALLLVVGAGVSLATGSFPRSIRLGDVDGDGLRELIVIAGSPREPFGRKMVIVFVDRLPWTGFQGLNPWKAATGDVDGDGRPELLVGVWKKARLDPVLDRRLFVYGWSKRGPAPKWLGSRLSRPFFDFEVKDADGDGDLELVATEMDRSGALSVRAYEWSGFGFQAVDAAITADTAEAQGSEMDQPGSGQGRVQ